MSIFFDSAMIVTQIIIAGLILASAGRYLAEKLYNIVQRRQASQVLGNLDAKVKALIQELERSTGLAVDKQNGEQCSAADHLQREHSNALGDLKDSVRQSLSSFRRALDHSVEKVGTVAAEWGADVWSAWSPTTGVPGVVRIGKIMTRHLAATFRETLPDLDGLVEMPALAKSR
jgi:hypothetical protein